MLAELFGPMLTGLAIAAAVWAGSGQLKQGIDLVERDLRDKLRRLRVDAH